MRFSCAELRQCGAGSILILRRLRAMLKGLMQTLPPHRPAALRQQLDLLDRTVETSWALGIQPTSDERLAAAE